SSSALSSFQGSRPPPPSGDSFISLASSRLRVNRPVRSSRSFPPAASGPAAPAEPAANRRQEVILSGRPIGVNRPIAACASSCPGRRLRKRQRPLPKSNWLRGRDLNPRPPGYEPDELPGCSTPRYENGARAGIRTRDLTVISRVLWPTELPSHMELMTGLEPVTSSLPRTCSTY